MSDKLHYLDCWISVATSLFSQALVGEPILSDSLPKPISGGCFGFAAFIEGDEEGRFSILLDGELSSATLFGEGSDQKAGWAELLKEVVDAASGELLAKTGRKCHVRSFETIESESKLSRAFQLKAGDRSWWIHVFSEVRVKQVSASAGKAAPAKAGPEKAAAAPAEAPGRTSDPTPSRTSSGMPANPSGQSSGLSPGLELLLDVELEASLRFGAREMPLGELLDLGPGDVVQLDRHIHDPVDLIVADKIIARGEVVLVNGNFGLRVTEVAEPQRRLESIRCLF
jgi:flagellar motor switch protein FliN